MILAVIWIALISLIMLYTVIARLAFIFEFTSNPFFKEYNNFTIYVFRPLIFFFEVTMITFLTFKMSKGHGGHRVHPDAKWEFDELVKNIVLEVKNSTISDKNETLKNIKNPPHVEQVNATNQ